MYYYYSASNRYWQSGHIILIAINTNLKIDVSGPLLKKENPKFEGACFKKLRNTKRPTEIKLS